MIDPGSSWTRVGFAGEDSPKAVVPTFYGKAGDDIYVGDNELHSPRSGMEVLSPMSDGCGMYSIVISVMKSANCEILIALLIVTDWDKTVKIWDYALSKRLYTDPKDHPLLVTEPSWNPAKNREKAVEVAFEQLGVPAFYLAREAVCSAYVLYN